MERTRLMPQLSPWAKVAVPLILLCSLVLNVIALLPGVPFLEISGFGASLLKLVGPYSILEVIRLLWDHQLYPLVIVVVGFSVLFPPIKLVLGTWALSRPMTMRGRERMLGALGHLGRWSLLDVFVSLLILVIFSKEGAVGATVEYGLYCFMGAIILSMIAGTIMHEAVRRLDPGKPLRIDRRRPAIIFAGWQGVISTILCVGSIIVIARAFFYPLFQIDQFGFASNLWSLKESIAFLYQSDLAVFASILAIFLIIAPIASMCMLLFALYAPLPSIWRTRTALMTRYISEWCMLDVFSLGMMLYLSEENNFAQLAIKPGMWYLFGSVVVFTGSLLWAEFAMRRAFVRRVGHILERQQNRNETDSGPTA